jgi:hypothetical protein
MFVFRFRAKMGSQRNVDKKAQTKHHGLIKIFII